MVHYCNFSSKLRQDYKFNASLDYIVRLCLRKPETCKDGKLKKKRLKEDLL